MEYSDFLLTMLTLCALAFTIGATIRSLKLASTLSRLDRFTDRLERLAPHLERLLLDAQNGLRSAERLTERMHDIADDAKVVSGIARRDLVPVIDRLAATGSTAAEKLHHINALVAATKAGFRALGNNDR